MTRLRTLWLPVFCLLLLTCALACDAGRDTASPSGASREPTDGGEPAARLDAGAPARDAGIHTTTGADGTEQPGDGAAPSVGPGPGDAGPPPGDASDVLRVAPITGDGRDAGAPVRPPVDGCARAPRPCNCGNSYIGETRCDDAGVLECQCPQPASCFPGEVQTCECPVELEDGSGAAPVGMARCLWSGDAITPCECPSILRNGLRVPSDIACLLRRKCGACHAELPLFGAPMPLVTFADLHAPTPSAPDVPVYATLAERIARQDATQMPPPGRPALTELELEQLLAWSAQGGPPHLRTVYGPPRKGPIPDDAWAVLEANCHTCHGEIPVGGAPRLLTLDDFWAPSSVYDPSRLRWEVAVERIRKGEMPQGATLSLFDRLVLERFFGTSPPDCTPL